MVIAGLLAVLGVDLIVVIAFVVLVVGRRRWLKRQSGEFMGAVRVSDGAVHGLGSKWKHGSGRWVRDVFVWSKAPLLLRNELVPVDGFLGERRAEAGEVKHLGDKPVVIELLCSDSKIEVAAKPQHRALAMGATTTVPTVGSE